jgi:hypothetical protein
MTIQAKLFYAGLKEYPLLKAADVESYYKTIVPQITEYAYTKEKDIYIITSSNETVSRLKGTEEEIQKQIIALKEFNEFKVLLDGLLQFVYDALIAGLAK